MLKSYIDLVLLNFEFLIFIIQKYLLLFLIFLPLIAIFSILFIGQAKVQKIKKIALFFSFLNFVFSLFGWLLFEKSFPGYQFTYDLVWFSFFNLHFSLGIDGISLFFILLSTLLIPICLLASWKSINKFHKEYVAVSYTHLTLPTNREV